MRSTELEILIDKMAEYEVLLLQYMDSHDEIVIDESAGEMLYCSCSCCSRIRVLLKEELHAAR